MRALAGCVLVVAAVACNRSTPPPTTAPAGLSAEARAHAQETIEQNCQLCHSLDLVQSQRLARPTWEQELEKMIGWGAPVPPEDVDAAATVLAEEFGVDSPPPSPPSSMSAGDVAASVAFDSPPSGGDAKHGAAVYQVACASCHGQNGAGGPIGPALIERPILHRARDFVAIVRDGRRRMPAVPLDAAAMRDLFAFLLAAHG